MILLKSCRQMHQTKSAIFNVLKPFCQTTQRILQISLIIITSAVILQVIVLILSLYLVITMDTSVNKINVRQELQNAVDNEDIMDLWDKLQTRYNILIGYQIGIIRFLSFSLCTGAAITIQ